MKPVTMGVALAILAVLTWALVTTRGDLAWGLTAVSWASEAFLLSTLKVLNT